MKSLGSFLALVWLILAVPRLGYCLEVKADTVVKVSGTITNSQTKEPIKASLTFEKLPYGDDMGFAQSAAEGNYQMFMLKSVEYNITVKAEGFKELSTKIIVAPLNMNGEFVKDFELSPDAAHEVIKLENLIFATGKASISPSSHTELDGLAKTMHDRPDIIVQLEGHTDFAGNAQANLELSQERVEAVKKYLVKKGIKKDRILLKAYGGSQPLTTDRSDAARRMNRRVEVRVVN